MTNDNKSIGTEEMEVTTMENVSLEGADVEQQKQNTRGNGGGTAPKIKNRYIGLAVLALLLVVGTIVGLVVGLNNNGGAPTKTATESESLEASETAVGEPNPTIDEPLSPFGEPILRGFSSDVIEGYASVEDFESDLRKTAEYLVQNVIQWNIHHYNQNAASDDDEDTTSVAMDAAVSASIASAVGDNPKAQKIKKPQNQEKDADEPDIVKSDENFLYSAHGDRMLVLDHLGNMVNEVLAKNLTGEYGYYDATSIRAIILTENHVMVVSEAYDDNYEISGLYDRDVTHLTVYTKPSIDDPSIQEVGSKAFNGYYQDGRWMQDSNSVQILTSGSLQTWNMIDQLSPTYFPWMSQEEYAKKAAAKASKKLIPEFVNGMIRDLLVNGELPTMLRLNAWTTEDQSESWKHFGEYFTVDQFFGGYTQITSFSVSELTTGREMKASSSVFFSPSSYATLYGTDDNIVVALTKSEWFEETQHSEDSTFLINMHVVEDGAATKFHSIKMLPGSLLNRYSLDVQGSELRVATTIRKWNALDSVWDACGDNYLIYEDLCMTESLWDQCMDVALDCPRGKVVKTGCPYTIVCGANADEDFSSTENYITVLNVAQEGEMVELGHKRIGEPHETITAVRFEDDYAYAMTFDQTDPFYVLKLEAGKAPVVSGTVTLHGFSNFLHVDDDQSMLLGIGQNSTGTGLDQINFGAMISTFDVSDPTNPQVVDSYMLEEDAYTEADFEPKTALYADGKLVLPVSVQHYQDYSYGYNYYVDYMHPISHGNGGTNQTNPESFEGFIVFDVHGADGIKELFRIDHTRKAGECSYCNSFYFSFPRSFLHDDGSLVTVRGQYIIATNMTTGEEIWRVEPHNEGDTKDCCW